VSDKNSGADRIDHLRKAAEHLQAAGLNSLADHIRGLSHTASAGGPSKDRRFMTLASQVLLHIKLLELDREKIRRLGLDFSPAQPLAGLPVWNDLVEALSQDRLARVLAEPTLVTVIGRPAHFCSGGEVPIWDIGPDGKPVQRPERYGTSVDFIPRLTDKRDLRLELRLEHSELDRTKTVLVAGKENPVIHKRVMGTALQMKFGETFALSWPLQAAVIPVLSALFVSIDKHRSSTNSRGSLREPNVLFAERTTTI